MQRFLRHLMACCWLGFALAPLAQPVSPQVAVISSDASAAYAQANQALVDALERGGLPKSAVELISPENLDRRIKDGTLASARLFVGVGARATQALLSADVSAPVLSVLIPRRSFEQLLQSSGRKTSAQLSALYLDQPLQRQLALVHLALPHARQVGVLFGPDSVAKFPELSALVQEQGMLLRYAKVTDDQALFSALSEVLDGSDVLLALADPLVFNSSSVQNILLSSFRARVPMVAFSPAYARAGAVLSLYSSPSQAGVQAADEVLTALRNGRLPALPVEPNDFQVDVNTQVARALGLTLDGETLRMALRRQERLP
ncbi:MAG: ABC transporter substrate binding protein [Rhodoferax sp.]|nr:ABC transporter substrate binding protein [Rhodoferax sp.]